jgi:hypothetical protein
MVKTINLAPEDIVATLDNQVEKELTLGILQTFTDNDLTYQTRTSWKSKDDTNPDSYRVFCYIKKSKEALIVNTKYYDTDSFLLQIRILNSTTFDKLSEYSENVRNQILHAQYNCKNCGCSEKAYVFTYQGLEYRKCHMICGNFRFCNLDYEDIHSIMDIINREIFLLKRRK